jgi:trans-aconitate methyltransferase
MNASDSKNHWETVYRTKPATQVSWYEETPALSRQLVREYAEPDRPVIDIGGGVSRLTGSLLQDGFTDLTVLDISGEALAVAKRTLGEDASRVEWIEADVRRWQPERRYALWHDRAAFHFLTDPADQRAYAETLKRALSPGGAAIIATFAPDGPEMCSGLLIVRHDAESILRVLGPDFTLAETRRHEHVTPKGAVQRFQFSVLRRL